MNRIVMLGPQAPRPNLAKAVSSLEFEGEVVSITAGWRDSEGEVDEISGAIGQPVRDLGLYQRAETVLAAEPHLMELHRERQDRLQELQTLYRIRLGPGLSSARTLLRMDGKAELLKMEQRAAISQVRALDRHHLKRIAAIHRNFNDRLKDLEIAAARSERQAVYEQAKNAGLVLIAGGHVAVLLNRIRLFRLEQFLADKSVIAWSAGAMVLGERIVLFHDNAPQGKRDAEVLDTGLGLVRDITPLPHARERLDWRSRTRMALFARRFAPSKCCTLDHGSSISLEGGSIVHAEGVSVMTRSGGKRTLQAK